MLKHVCKGAAAGLALGLFVSITVAPLFLAASTGYPLLAWLAALWFMACLGVLIRICGFMTL